MTKPKRLVPKATHFLLLLFICIITPPSYTQDAEIDYSPQEDYLKSPLEQRSIKENKWQKAVKGLDYTPPKVKERRARKTDNRPTGNARMALTIAGILLIAIIIALAIAAWSGYLKPKPKKIDGLQVSIDDIEENIFENDLRNLLQEAINKGQYNLAIRLYFLEILKALAVQKKIKWKKEKTNRIYFYELNTSGLAKDFNQLSIIFDRIRYGGVSLDQSDFLAIEPRFKGFLENLQKTKV